ncbi:MAG: M42 family peptidase [Candidatus Methanoliparum thermophilum]|uniref:M42 family peptidase n=1 Tax=Methanoliparum thermophilum TaxID=2491083 RepID=A0A520KQG5_METT2|nr:M42 family metallopeptidase [Candidatus Methanoliparum sp. LAM-1]RZN63810.1 MAG: M42 family peptidase [Candidatus Methanoliparum thermophilum]BDC36466.1 peptidase M42 [Candidatus Methanoliparum sp. LAM-1]
MERVRETLEKLSNACGISGRECNIREILEDEMKDCVDEIKEDALGNLIAIKYGKKPKETRKKVMLAAHMDEIGLMVKYIDDDGFIRFIGIGGWFYPSLLNTQVILHGSNGPIKGVIGSKPPHILSEEERKKQIRLEDLFIDIGAKNREEVRNAGIREGTPVTIDVSLKDLLNDRVTGKSLDNRAGLTVLIEFMRRIDHLDCDIYAVGTVQEEVGLKGAKTSSFEINPDFALVIDTTIPQDHPGIDPKRSMIEIDKGPVITIADASGRGLIAPEKIIDWLINVAKDKDIPYQLEVSEGGTTDATSIHLSRAGIPTGVISIPTRYIHSPVEVLSIKDIDNTVELIVQALKDVDL